MSGWQYGQGVKAVTKEAEGQALYRTYISPPLWAVAAGWFPSDISITDFCPQQLIPTRCIQYISIPRQGSHSRESRGAGQLQCWGIRERLWLRCHSFWKNVSVLGLQ